MARGRTMNEDEGSGADDEESSEWADYETYFERSIESAIQLFHEGDYSEAIAAFERLLEHIDQDWRDELPGKTPKLLALLYYYLGMSLLDQARRDQWTDRENEFLTRLEGIELFARLATQLDPNESKYRVFLSEMVLTNQVGEEDDESLDYVGAALRGVLMCMPPNQIDSAWAFHQLALLEKSRLNLYQALSFASAAVQLDPGNSDYWNTFGDAHPSGSHEALYAYEKAVSIENDASNEDADDSVLHFSGSEQGRRSTSAKQCERSRLIIFDLDGTLANTANIEQQNRTPATLLAPGVDAEGRSLQAHQWEWSQDVSETPARLIERGHKVVIATNSPLPYASTLTHLLGVEHQGLHTNCGGETGKANRIKQICSSYEIMSDDVIYVGDQESDARTAASAGVSYMTVDQLRSGELLDELGTPLRGHDFTPALLNGLVVPQYWKEELSSGRVPFSRPDSPATMDERKLFETFAAMSEWAKAPRLDNCDFLNSALAMADEADALAPYYRTILQYALRIHSGLPARRDIQFLLLKYAAPDEGADLTGVVNLPMHEFFAFRPGLLTRREKNRDSNLRLQYLHVFRKLFPALTNGNLSCVVNYWGDGEYGSLLKTVKDYRTNPKGPGPSVRLGLLDGVADMCAGIMSLHRDIPIVPVPSSPFQVDKPGQNSTRLARGIADRTERRLIPVLEIDPAAPPGQKEFRINPKTAHLLARGSTYDLFDDQITSGLTVQKCQNVMEAGGYRLNQIFTYSAKASNIAGARQNSTGGANEGAHLNRWRHLKIRLEEGI